MKITSKTVKNKKMRINKLIKHKIVMQQKMCVGYWYLTFIQDLKAKLPETIKFEINGLIDTVVNDIKV